MDALNGSNHNSIVRTLSKDWLIGDITQLWKITTNNCMMTTIMWSFMLANFRIQLPTCRDKPMSWKMQIPPWCRDKSVTSRLKMSDRLQHKQKKIGLVSRIGMLCNPPTRHQATNGQPCNPLLQHPLMLLSVGHSVPSTIGMGWCLSPSRASNGHLFLKELSLVI